MVIIKISVLVLWKRCWRNCQGHVSVKYLLVIQNKTALEWVKEIHFIVP